MAEYVATNEPEVQKRRSARIVQNVPLTVTAVDALGQPFKERTSSLNINCHGCKYSSKHYVLRGSWLTLEVPHSLPGQPPRMVRARVTWIQRPRSARDLFQIGVELEVSGNIWGIAFPPPGWFPFPELSPAGIFAAGPEATPRDQAAVRTPAPERDEKPRELPRPAGAPLPPAAAPEPRPPAEVERTQPAPSVRPEFALLGEEARQQIREAARETTAAMVAAETDRLLRVLSAQLQEVAQKAVQAVAASSIDQAIRVALGRTEALLEDAAKETQARVSEHLNEARDTSLASFADEAHTLAREKLEQLSRTAEASVSEITAKMEQRLRQSRGRASAVIEQTVGEFQERVAQQLDRGLAQARERGEQERHAALAHASNGSLEEYKQRLQSASNACLAAAVTTLHVHTQAALRSLTESAQTQVREMFAAAVAEFAERMRERLLSLSAEVHPAPKPPEKT